MAISVLRRSWGLLDQICLHTSTGKTVGYRVIGSARTEFEAGISILSSKRRSTLTF